MGRGFGGSSIEEEGGTWELYHQRIILTKSTFFLKAPDCSFKEIILCLFPGFILLFGGPGRKGLHTLIFKNHIIFLIWCTAAAFPFSLCLERSVLAVE